MDDKKTKTARIITFSIIMIVIIILMRVVVAASQTSTKYDALAQCLTDKGVKFYGAFWCPHCQAQKRRFGASVKLLPYVECSTPDGKDQTQICIDKKITGYPTWVFPDGSQLTGEHELSELAEKSGCVMPDGPTTGGPVSATSGASSAAK